MITPILGDVTEYIALATEYVTGDQISGNLLQELLKTLPAPDKAIIDRVESIFGRIEDASDANAHRLLNTFAANLYTRAIRPNLREIPKDEPKKGLLVQGEPRPPLRTMMNIIFVLVVQVVRIYQENHNVHFFRRLFKIELDKLEHDANLKK